MTNTLSSSKNILIKNFDLINRKKLPLNNFNEIFYAIRKNLHIKQSRKCQVDSLLKKAKCKFFQTIHEIMKYSLSIRIKRLPQPFITNITIEYNRCYLEKTVFQIYKEFNLFVNLQKIEDDIIKINNKELLKEFTKYKLDDLYNIYIESQSYKKSLDEIIAKSGKNIGILYEFVSKNLLSYYRYNKSKIPKKEDEKEDEKANNNNNSDEDIKEKNTEEEK